MKRSKAQGLDICFIDIKDHPKAKSNETAKRRGIKWVGEEGFENARNIGRGVTYGLN